MPLSSRIQVENIYCGKTVACHLQDTATWHTLQHFLKATRIAACSFQYLPLMPMKRKSNGKSNQVGGQKSSYTMTYQQNNTQFLCRASTFGWCTLKPVFLHSWKIQICLKIPLFCLPIIPTRAGTMLEMVKTSGVSHDDFSAHKIGDKFYGRMAVITHS